MSVPAQPVLYDFWRASSAWRVRLALNLKGIAYETRSINLFADENKTEAYRKIQPFGAVPAFIDNRGDGRVLIESVAILEYLEETRSETPLLPKDPVDRAAVRALVLAFGMDIQPLCSIRVAKHLGQDKAGDWSKYWMSEGFAGMDLP
ncbi:Glutathione S-transferase zeta-1 [Dissophora globulifera]|uniref:Glutathione S-transferase zeta-1 n=1 Tax=Dissophora globulifera TaxID=979702 RepID=A0A9P6UKS2_9FUNG|nr:Glutathione S-transferase zeta-1 [Dissophora globulifera]